MQLSEIISHLREYDKDKGFARTFLHDEPHISELREFVAGIAKNRGELTASELLALTNILLGKKNRDGVALSTQLFNSLAKKLGGYEVLVYLKNHGKLTKEMVAFMEKQSIAANILAPQLVNLSKKIEESTLHMLLKAAATMPEPQLLVKALNIDKTGYQLFQYISIVIYLCQHNIYTSEIWQLLATKNSYEHILPIFQTLEKSALLEPTNMQSIITLSHPIVFNKFLKLIPVNQRNLNWLFAVEKSLDKAAFTEEILVYFNEINIDPAPWLESIFNGVNNNSDLYLAINSLQTISINPDYLGFILNEIVNASEQKNTLAKAIVTLNAIEFDESMVRTVAASLPFSNEVAQAIVRLKEADRYNSETLKFVCTVPEHASWLAFNLIHKYRPVDQIAFYNKINRQSELLLFLHDRHLLSFANLVTTCTNEVFENNTLDQLIIMEKIKPLSQPDVDRVFSKLSSKNSVLEISHLLIRHELYTDNLMHLLYEQETSEAILQILLHLENNSPNLITSDRVICIFKLKYPSNFNTVLKLITCTSENIDNLLSVEENLKNGVEAQSLIDNFNQAGWDPTPWLTMMFRDSKDIFSLYRATEYLKRIVMKPAQFQLIFTRIFAVDCKKNDLAEGLFTLHRMGLMDSFLNTVLNSSHPKNVAKAIVALNKSKLFNDDTLAIICSRPRYAHELASILIGFDMERNKAKPIKKNVLKVHENMNVVAAILFTLQENNLYTAANIKLVCKQESIEKDLLSLLTQMSNASILNQINLDVIFNLNNAISLLCEPVNQLATSDKLDQSAFDRLVTELTASHKQPLANVVTLHGEQADIFFPSAKVLIKSDARRHEHGGLCEGTPEWGMI